MDRTCSVHRETHRKLFVDKPQRKRPLGKPRQKWEENIKGIVGKLGVRI